MGEKVDWSNLPIEILPTVGENLKNRIDIVRFRSVSKSMRSSIPPPHPNSPSFPFRIPYLRNPYPYVSFDVNVTQTVLYGIEWPGDSFDTEPSTKWWLIKVEESQSVPMRLLNPVSNRQIMPPSRTPPTVWDLSDYRVYELCKSYNLQHCHNKCSFDEVHKVVVFPNSCREKVEDSVIFCIYEEGQLNSMRYGDKRWRLVDDQDFHYDDIIVYNGQVYVVDRWGAVSLIDLSSLKLIPYSPPLGGSENKKVLVESCGSLCVVDRYYEGEPGRRRENDLEPELVSKVVDFKIYKLDEEQGVWAHVKSLDDRVFILGGNCNISISAKEFAGYQGNCIYFFDFADIRMYNLNDRSIVKVECYPSCSELFWPPPSWLKSATADSL